MMDILIAEDDDQIADSLRKHFSEEGHHVMIAKNGEEAVHYASSILFDILLLDWRMPKKNGLEVCRQLRGRGYKLPIILLTALNQISNKVEALHMGADDYVTKPFSFEELSARMDAVIRRYQSNTDELYFEDLRLDLISRKIYSPRGEIFLSSKEFDLLRFFILNKGSVVCKDELFEKVWDLPFTPTTNIIEVTVKNLRKKLEDNTGKNLIKSIYGEGYLFIAD